MKQYEKEKKNKFIQPRPEVLLLLLNIQLTTAKGHHLVLKIYICLNTVLYTAALHTFDNK
jgi:hypothetical protein